jgi:hypothetical protein
METIFNLLVIFICLLGLYSLAKETISYYKKKKKLSLYDKNYRIFLFTIGIYIIVSKLSTIL